MYEQMVAELVEMIKSKRELNRDVPFLSEYENGVREGVNDTLDDTEAILSKYISIPVNEIELFAKEPKNIWGRMKFSNNNYTDSHYLQFIQELGTFDTKDNIEERKNDTAQWNENQDEHFYWIDALFSEREANHVLWRFKGSFSLLQAIAVKEEEPRLEVDNEWLVAYIEEEKAIYGEKPSASQILLNWERNKEYFLANKGKPFGLVKADNQEGE